MINRRILAFCLTLVLCEAGLAQVRISSYDADAVVRAREAWRTGATELKPALDRLKQDADSARALPLHSVMEKSQTASSGDKHDYMSLARYYWPDSAKPGGLPYVSRDGVPNPEILTITDATYFAEMVETANTLALAAFIFNDERAGARAAAVLRTWFLDTATAMNPNLEHAQLVKGMDDGRPAGTIETRDIGLAFDAAGLLRAAGSKSWTSRDQEGLERWAKKYLLWLTTSKRAIAASKFENNIAIWFAVQAGSVALFAGDTTAARAILLNARSLAVDRQIEPDGSQPQELKRTISAHYVLFNIEAFFRLAELAEHAGIDLWNYRSADGRSIKSSLDWNLPFLKHEKEWTWKQIKPFDWANEYYRILEQASVKFGQPEYGRLARRLAGSAMNKDRIHLYYRTGL